MSKGTSIIGFILSFIAGAILMWGIEKGSGGSSTHAANATEEGSASGERSGSADGGAKFTGKPKSNAVKVEFYVMSKCPFGTQVEDAMKDVVAKFGDDIDFKVDFIGKNNGGEFQSLHGPTEVMGDIYQTCAQKYAQPLWYDAMLCQNKEMQKVDSNWEQCAGEAGIKPDVIQKVKECAQGQEGKDLLTASFAKAEARKAGGSPTIYIGEQQYQGGRKPADFMKGICNAFQGTKPAACSDIPETPKVNVTILGDKRCAECNTAGIERAMNQRLGAPVITTLDISDPAGKKLFAQFAGIKLPAAVFDKTLEADAQGMQAFNGAKQMGDYRVLVAGDWNPVCADEGGCSIAECKETIGCREEIPNKLDVFVMSQCPFGVKGLDAMQEVLANFRENKVNIDFQIHYIGDGEAAKGFSANAKGTDGGLSSMHGPEEVKENVRELCAMKQQPKDLKFMEYIWCRDKNIKDTAGWASCTGEKLGFDTDEMTKCSEGDEGKKLLEASYAVSKNLGIGSSPTWLANNKFKFSGVDPETIKSNFCKYNKVAGCEKTLSGPPPRPAGNNAPAPGCGG